MLFSYDYTQTMILVLSYMLIYNLTSFLLFTTLTQYVNSNANTLYSFSNLGATNIFTNVLALSVLSLAGVPPLVGFFSKIFVFILVSKSTLFVLFVPFFILLFVGLYFYVQNLRFLNSTNSSTFVPSSELQTRANFLYFTFALPLSFFTIFGFCYIDDLLLLSAWLLL